MYENCTVLGDKGYLSIDYQRDFSVMWPIYDS